MTAPAVTATTTVADAMITDVKLSDRATTVRDLRRLFDDEHVHSAVVVDDGFLIGVVDRCDVGDNERDEALAISLATRTSRVAHPDDDLEQVRLAMLVSGRRRLAVIDADGTLRGLLCLKRTRAGFCSNEDVHDRATAGQVTCVSHRP